MTDTEKCLAEIKARAADGRTECCVCLSPVIHHAADEGTQSYERVVSRTDIQRLVAMVEYARNVFTVLRRTYGYGPPGIAGENALDELDRLARGGE